MVSQAILIECRRIELRERTAEKIFPSDEVSTVFGNDSARGLIEGPIEPDELDLRNVGCGLPMPRGVVA